MRTAARQDKVEAMTSLDELRLLIVDAADVAWEPPSHILRRIAALLRGEPAVFVDRQNNGHTGDIFVLTPSRVILASFTDAAPVEQHALHQRASVEVDTWRRVDLCKIAVDSDGEEGWNSDYAWQQSKGDTWPEGARVTLTYQGQAPLCLPLQHYPHQAHRAAMHSIMDELLADLR